MLVARDPIGPLSLQHLERIYLRLFGELVLQELCVHEVLTFFAFDDHDVLDYIFVGEEPEDRSFFLAVPNYHTLVVGTRSKCSRIF